MENKRKNIIVICVIILLTNVFTFYIASNTTKSVLPSKKTQTLATYKGGKYESSDLYDALLNQQGLDTLLYDVDRALLEKKYPSSKDPVKSDVDAQIKAYKDQFESSGSSLKAELEKANLTEKELREQLAYSIQSSLLGKDYVKKDITDEELQAEYKKQSGKFETSHILIKSENNPEAQAQAQAILDELVATGDVKGNFAAFATKYSQDEGSKDKGGSIGFSSPADLVPEYTAAAQALKEGEYTTSLVSTQFGFHIILKGKTEATPKFEDVKKELENTIAETKVQSDQFATQKAQIELREEYGFKIKDSKLRKKYENKLKELDESMKQAKEAANQPPTTQQ